MNWVGGARSRVCKADFKSKKGQQKLQKEYFERRRLGTININAIGKGTKKNQNPREDKCHISQDILDFQNLKHQMGRDVNPDRTRAAFRVVNLTKKLTTSKPANPSGSKYEEVEMPLSPVDKHSTLNLSCSPPSQEYNTDASYTTSGASSKRQHPSLSYLTSKTLDTNYSHGKGGLSKHQQHSHLSMFDRRGLENMPHVIPVGGGSSSTIDLFGTTMQKPEKLGKSVVMPPPASFGITGTKAKKSKWSAPDSRLSDRWKSAYSSDSDYPIDDTLLSDSSMTGHKNRQIPEHYENTPVLHYSSTADVRKDTANFQLVPSQSSCSLKNEYNHSLMKNNNNNVFENPNSFKLFSPLRATDFTSAKEVERDEDIFSGVFFSKQDGIASYNDSASTSAKEYYSPEWQSSSVMSNRKGLASFRNNSHDMERDIHVFNDKQYVPDNENYSSWHSDHHVDDFSSSYNCSTNSNFLHSEIFQSQPENTRQCSSVSFCDESSLNNHLYSACRSTYVEKSVRSEPEGNVLVNERMSAEWFNVSREPKATPQRDNCVGKDEPNGMRRDSQIPPSFFQDTSIQFFEPLQASTPCNAPICLNTQAMDMDMNQKHEMSLDKDKGKIYGVNGLLDEMMDLETQTQSPGSLTGKKSPKDVVQAPCKMNDTAAVDEVMSSLLSRVEAALEPSTKNMNPESLGLHNLINQHNVRPIRSQAKCTPTEQTYPDKIKKNPPGSKTYQNQYKDCTFTSQNGLPQQKATLTSSTTLSNSSDNQMKICGEYSVIDECCGTNYDQEITSQKRNPDNNNTICKDLLVSPNLHCFTSRSKHSDMLVSLDNLPQPMSHQNDKSDLSGLSTCLIENANSTGSVNDINNSKHMETKVVTVSTQTVQARTTDQACSPIIFSPCGHRQSYIDKDFHAEKKNYTPKVYSLRPRARLCDNYLSKQEE